MKRAAAIAGAVLLAAGVYFVLGARESSAPSPTSASAPSAPASAQGAGTPRLRAEAVLTIAPGSPASRQVQASLPASLREFLDAKSYAGLFKRLKDSPNRSGEEHWMYAKILEQCGRWKSSGPRRDLGGDEAKARLAASLSPRDPNREKRLAAFDRTAFDPCWDVDAANVSDAELIAILELGAAAGDSKARAMLVAVQLRQQTTGPDGTRVHGRYATISDGQVETLRQAFMSGDPLAMREVGQAFTRPMQNLSLRVAESDVPVDMNAMNRALVLAMCEFGYPCGASSRELAEACAINGQCEASGYADYVYYYGSSPAGSQLTAAYADGLLRAARRGDWSYFGFHNGPPPIWALFGTGK